MIGRLLAPIRSTVGKMLTSDRSHPDTKEGTMDTNALRSRLTQEQFNVTQNGGTERPFSGIYWNEKTPGLYRCIVCNQVLFDSEAKFDSGTGWPSFTSEIESGRVRLIRDRSHGMLRTEARCSGCDAHLGHVFNDGPGVTRERYCMNSASLHLDADAPGSPVAG